MLPKICLFSASWWCHQLVTALLYQHVWYQPAYIYRNLYCSKVCQDKSTHICEDLQYRRRSEYTTKKHIGTSTTQLVYDWTTAPNITARTRSKIVQYYTRTQIAIACPVMTNLAGNGENMRRNSYASYKKG